MSGPDSDYLDMSEDMIEKRSGDGQPAAAPSGGASKAATAAMLPAYCDPPNPCPPGYTSADGCIDDFENSSDYSRNFQAKQNSFATQSTCSTVRLQDSPARPVSPH